MRTVEAVPSRVVGVGRFLLSCKGSEKQSAVEAMMSPSTLRNAKDTGDEEGTSGGDTMIRKVIRECIGMDLCAEQAGILSLAPAVSESFPKLRFDSETMRAQLRRLILRENSEANRDLGLVLTWFMEQEPLSYGLDKERRVALVEALRAQTGERQLQITNNASADNFAYWAVYLGFAWKMNMGRATGERLIPDPTPFLTQVISEILPLDQEVPLAAFMERLAELYPVFHGSSRHSELEGMGALPPRESQYLAPALSFALKRLEERGVLKLIPLSDAQSQILRVGDQTQNISHLERLI